MRQFHSASKQCPVCQCRTVRRNEGSSGLRSPSHQCTACGADLAAGLAAQALWAIPVGAGATGAALLVFNWLSESRLVEGALLVAAFGALFGGAYGVTAQCVLRAIVYRRWQPK